MFEGFLPLEYSLLFSSFLPANPSNKVMFGHPTLLITSVPHTQKQHAEKMNWITLMPILIQIKNIFIHGSSLSKNLQKTSAAYSKGLKSANKSFIFQLSSRKYFSGLSTYDPIHFFDACKSLIVLPPTPSQSSTLKFKQENHKHRHC